MNSKRLFSLLVAALNIYMLGAWTYAYNNYPIHLLRVSAFRRYFADMSLGLINLLIVALTIVSIVFVLKLKEKSLRYTLLAIHVLTLVFVLWTNL